MEEGEVFVTSILVPSDEDDESHDLCGTFLELILMALALPVVGLLDGMEFGQHRATKVEGSTNDDELLMALSNGARLRQAAAFMIFSDMMDLEGL